MSKNNLNLKVLVVCHKPCNVYKDANYIPIHVGRAKSTFVNEMKGILGDDTGDNISDKNASYCELTALYWAWKNLKNVDYVGLCHYRRYFLKYRSPFRLPIYYCTSLDSMSYDIIKNDDLYGILHKNDVIMARNITVPYNLRTEYSYILNSYDYKILKQVIMDMYPDYVYDFERIMYYGNKYSAFNMMVMKWEYYDDYCNWLFSILFELENRIDISNYKGYYARIYGYISERLLNVYVLHNSLKVKKLSVGMLTDNPKSVFRNFIGYIIHKTLNSISFMFNKPIHKEKLVF